MAATRLFAGLELGGTKCVCVLGSGPDDLIEQQRLPTRDPVSTLGEIDRLLESWIHRHGPLAAVGIASFGPLDLSGASATYGSILSTPKPGWSNTRVLGHFVDRLKVPVGLDTDVVGAALAEGRWGASRGLTDHAYVTVGTGIGVGLIVRGAPVYGCHHAEMGHMRIGRLRGDDWPGSCRFHGDCVEGLASGPAIEARTGFKADVLPAEHPVWDCVVHALTHLFHNMVLTTAPQRIVAGGGVLATRTELFPRLRKSLLQSLGGYVSATEVTQKIDEYLVPPALGGLAGPLGALVLASDAADEV